MKSTKPYITGMVILGVGVLCFIVHRYLSQPFGSLAQLFGFVAVFFGLIAIFVAAKRT